MTQILWLWKKWLATRLAVGIPLSLLLLMHAVALASEPSNDHPPGTHKQIGGSWEKDERPPDTRGRSGGSRGDCDSRTETSADGIPALILLEPTQHLGRTVATRPTFAWFVRAPGSWQMEFKLYKYDPASKKAMLVKDIKDENFKSSPGIMVLSLSQSIPELSVGQTYVWQVKLICNPSAPAGNIFAQAAIKVVEMPPDLKTALSQTNDKFNKAALYAKAHSWYDALGMVLTAWDEPRMRELKFSLLEEVAAGEEEKAVREKERVELTKSQVNQMQR